MVKSLELTGSGPVGLVRTQNCAFHYVCFRGNSGHRMSSGSCRFMTLLVHVFTQPGPRADVGCLAASSVWTAVRAIASCGWSRYAALTVQAEELLRMSESIHEERTASEPQDRSSSVAHSIEVPSEIIRKWQEIVNLLAEIMHVPSASIMRVDPPHIKVFG